MEFRDVGLAVKRLQVRHHRAMDAALSEIGLSLVQWDALRHLGENPDASLHTLAQLTFQTDQSMGALALRMIDRGLIARIDGPGRAVRHEMTEHGLASLQRGTLIVERLLTDSFAPLSKSQFATFGRLLRLLLEN